MGAQLFLFLGKSTTSYKRSNPLIMLTKHALEEYKQIHREETGTVLPDDVLANEAINLLTLFNFVYRPIKKAFYTRRVPLYHKSNSFVRGF